MKIENLIRLLNENAADYVIIGAQACASHGYVRATTDIDILIKPSKENIQKVRSAKCGRAAPRSRRPPPFGRN